MKNKVMYFSILGILLLIGISYAVWQLSFTQASPNVATSACFSLTFEDSNDITLNSAYPLTDEEGRALTPYTFTITNNCAEYASYQVNLEVLNTTTIDSAYIKSEFNNTVKLVSAYPTTTKTLNNASTAYKLLTGYLDPNEEVTYTLKLWIDYNSTAEQSANKIYDSKITIASTYKENNPTPQEECEKTYGEGATICNIIGQADSTNDKCLHVYPNGRIVYPSSTMSDSDTPIICTMEDDYGTSYYLRGLHTTNNVKFANMCWKLIRITGTGGYKLIYNGDLDANGKCTTTSGEHTGFTGQALSLSGNKVYGTSYTKSGSTYTLTDTSTLNWPNDSASIIGRYTCGNTNTSCTTLYAVTGELSSSQGYALKLGQSTNYAQIGTSSFNLDTSTFKWLSSLAYVGYMYNDVYTINEINLSSNTNNYYYGSSFTYTEGAQRPYTLMNTIQFSDITSTSNKLNLAVHHYTCFYADDNTCDELYYIVYLNGTSPFYIKLQGNEDINDVLDKMIRNGNINVKDSHIKGVIDWWYEQNIKDTEYESYLEDTIFCNDRTIVQLGGWSESGYVAAISGLTSESDISLDFPSYSNNNIYYLKCPNKRDAFTVGDTQKGNGALHYPIGLLTDDEQLLVGNITAQKTNSDYWIISPWNVRFTMTPPVRVQSIYSGGGMVHSSIYTNLGVRPSISLKPGTEFKEGTDGTASNPYEVE